MTDILGAERIDEFGPLVQLISDATNTLIPLYMSDGTGAHASIQTILDESNRTVIAYLTSGATTEWVSGEYARETAVHYTDPAKLVSGTYVASAPVSDGVVPPASPWLLSALDGKDGVSAVSTITTTRPNVPAVGSDATYSVGSAAGYGIGMYVDIINASATSLGTFLIVGITTTSLTLRNVTAIATTTVSTGFTVVASGKPGTNGTNGTSAIATASAFTQPAVNANVNVTVNSSAGFVDKQPLFHNLGGYYKVSGAPPSATTVTLQNLGYAGNIAAAASVGAGTLVPSGLKGADASGSGHTIQEEGVSLTQRSKLNFVGASAAATDDAANDATVITLTSSGGATGIKYTLNTAAGTPTAGEIRSTDLSLAGTIAISATDAATPGKSAADILARIKVGAIIVIAKSQTEQIRATVTTDYTVGSGSFAIAAPLVDGAIGNGAIVFLSIASDATSAEGGVSAGSITATASADSISLTEVLAPSGFNWVPLIRSFYRGNSAQFPLSSGTLLSGTSLPLNDTGLASGTYYYRMIVADQAGIKAYTTEVFATATSTTFNADTIAGINAVEATGVTLTGAQKTAADNFIVALKNPANGALWTRLRGLYLFLGGTAASHVVNWRNPGVLTATNNGAGLIHDATGVKGGGTGYMQIPFNPPVAESSSNAFAVYVSQNSTSTNSNVCLTALGPGFLGIQNDAAGSVIFNYSNASPSDPLLSGTGSLLFSKNSASAGKSYKDGQFRANLNIGFAGNPATNPLVTLLARGNYPSADEFTNAKIASFALFNASLSDTEAIAYTSADRAFQTALGRS
jgi:hypothetical protein